MPSEAEQSQVESWNAEPVGPDLSAFRLNAGPRRHPRLRCKFHTHHPGSAPHQQHPQRPGELGGYSKKLFLFSIGPKTARCRAITTFTGHFSQRQAPGKRAPGAWPSVPLLLGAGHCSSHFVRVKTELSTEASSHSGELAPRPGLWLSATGHLGTLLGTGAQDSALFQEGPVPGSGEPPPQKRFSLTLCPCRSSSP